MCCVDSDVISLFFRVFFFFWSMLVSILLHSGKPKASILMMVANDSSYVGCVGSVREMIVLKK